MANNPFSLDKTIDTILSDIEIYEVTYSTGEDIATTASKTLDFGTIDISGGDSTSKEIAVLLRSPSGADRIVTPIKVFAKLKNWGTSLVMNYGTIAALTGALGAAGAAATVATTGAIGGSRVAANDLTFTAGGSDSYRLALQIALTAATWGIGDYDPAQDVFKYMGTLGFYYNIADDNTAVYDDHPQIGRGYEDTGLSELFDIEMNIEINDYEQPMGNFENGIEFTTDVTTIQKMMRNPKVNTLIGREQVDYGLSGTLSVSSPFMEQILDDHDETYNPADHELSTIAKDRIRLKTYKVSFRTITKDNRLLEIVYPRCVLYRNGATTRHMDQTLLPVMIVPLYDEDIDGNYTKIRSTTEVGLAYIDMQMTVTT